MIMTPTAHAIRKEKKYENQHLLNGRVYEINDNAPCLLSQDTIGFRYSPKITDKLNRE